MTPPDDRADRKDKISRRPWPQLGDLAVDSAKNNRIGVVVGLPGERGSEWLTFHLQAPGGGEEWSAAADGSTLRQISSQISHATTKVQLNHDAEAGHWTLEIQLRYDDGSIHDGFLIVAENQAEELIRQFSRKEPTR
ncbi:hypothetical protein ACFWY5_22325 [Nonomuraea sp. NPDC059007]|uniref:hypothetical protein n=1 Tax=Nonomuraea sp. NPDC059007 TaxID=3346692 RepID=UPI00368CF106